MLAKAVKSSMTNQKRSSIRIPLARVEGKYRILGKNHSWERCEILNIALGGVSVLGERSFFVGDRIQLAFFLVKDDMYLQAEVTHISGRRCGVKFLIVHKDQEEVIQKFLKKHSLAGTKDEKAF